jgi:hypothetical protein
MKKIVKSVIPLTFALALSAGVPFGGSREVSADPEVCNPFCVTSQCTQHSDCTAAPGGKCNFACPHTGCCVYD